MTRLRQLDYVINVLDITSNVFIYRLFSVFFFSCPKIIHVTDNARDNFFPEIISAFTFDFRELN